MRGTQHSTAHIPWDWTSSAGRIGWWILENRVLW